ncbi:diguanylate cyclase (GGDEF) domain-containing protein [Marinospirillum celere]|uniref:Diguanylate cyclase (GGDEF) domain-containing protein n=2 Tax=Marinospirillum celere TaxID=1122252 RepID=A0A1I1E7R8_9GAMM|nr:diguanylate cyclase (GGDEF) domain-containing protein [Marinospirillum celere]
MSDPDPKMPPDPTLQKIFGLLETGLILCNDQGQIFLWNAWMERVTGITSHEASQAQLHLLFTTQPSKALQDAIKEACKNKLSRRLSHQLHPYLLPLQQPGKDQQLHHSIMIRPLEYQGQAACLLQINDVSSAVRRELHLREAEALLRFEKEILSLVAHNQPINKVWQALCEGIEKLAPGAEAGLLLLNAEQGLVNPLAAKNQLLPSNISLDSTSPASLAALSQELQKTPGWWACPLITADEQLAGVLQLGWPEDASTPTGSQTLLERSTQLASIALQNHHQLLQVRHLAEHDSLTGLANRSQLTRKLQEACEAASSKPFSLLFIDLDGFKAINDTHGHDAGDALLVELAQRLEQLLPKEDLAARLGGDELIVLSPSHSTLDEAYQLAEKLNQLLAQPFPWQDTTLSTGASIGIAVFPDQGTSANQLLTQADNAMYLAKSRGKGQAASCDLPSVVYNAHKSNSEG